jgi:hypothetical protein
MLDGMVKICVCYSATLLSDLKSFAMLGLKVELSGIDVQSGSMCLSHATHREALVH